MASLAQRIEELLADEVAIRSDNTLLHRALGPGDGMTRDEKAFHRVEVLFAAWEEMHREMAAIKAVLLDPSRAHRLLTRREIAHAMRGGPCFNCGEPLAAHRLEEEFGLVCPTDAAARTEDERFTYEIEKPL